MKQERKSIMNLMYGDAFDSPVGLKFPISLVQIGLEAAKPMQIRNKKATMETAFINMIFFISDFNVCSKEHRHRPILLGGKNQITCIFFCVGFNF